MDRAAAELTHELGGAEAMDVSDVFQQARDAWTSLPQDTKQDVLRRARILWQLRGIQLQWFLRALIGVYSQNPEGWQAALLRDRGQAVTQLALMAGRAAGLKPRSAPTQPGLSTTQVRTFHQRQLGRGFVPGRNRQVRQRGSLREFEMALEVASRDLLDS